MQKIEKFLSSLPPSRGNYFLNDGTNHLTNWIESTDIKATVEKFGLTDLPSDLNGARNIRRIEAIEFIIGLRGDEVFPTRDGGFPDVVVSWEKKYTKQAKELHIVDGVEMPDGSTFFFPHYDMTKGEAAKVIVKSLKK